MSALVLLALAGCNGLDPKNAKDADDGPAGSLCPPDLEVFTDQVWEPVLSRDCVVCHAPGGVAAESAFHLFPDDVPASMVATFEVADRLLQKPTGKHTDGHGGGTVLAEGSQGADALAFWVGWINGTCEVPEPLSCEDRESPRLLRRLTHTEYSRTIADLFGVSLEPGSFASDPVVDGFRNDAHALVVSDLLADQYRSAAEDVADVADLGALLPCSVTAGDAVCVATFVEDFGLRVFRRPLTQADVDRYVGLWGEIVLEDGFEEGVRWVIAAMLQSPNFLYRSELGVQSDAGQFTLTGWEIATSLAYTIWGTTPDAAILARAASGALDTLEGIAALATEMLADPRALDTAADLVEVWLDTGPLDTVSRDGLTPLLRAEMRQETRDLVTSVASAGGTLADLMTARSTTVSSDLASHYGLTGSGQVALDGVRYGGLLTQGSVLTTHGRPSGSGPVQRGVMLRERLLCEDLLPPPSNLDVSPPEIDPTTSTRDQYAEHSSNPACSVCHERIDPLGFAFEHYDELGRFRDDDGGHAIDDSGAVDDVPFVGPFALAETLLDDARFRSCYVTTWRRHATGIEACATDPGDQVGLLAPLAETLLLPGFRARVGGPSEGDTLAVGTRIVPDAPDEPELPEGEMTLDFRIVDDWGAGACWDGIVTNGSDDAGLWEVRAPVDGTLYNIWNAYYRTEGSEWVFNGEDWNDWLEPGEQVSFGLCAQRY